MRGEGALRLFVATPHPIVCYAVKKWVEDHSCGCWIAQAGSLAGAISALRETDIDLALVDAEFGPYAMERIVQEAVAANVRRTIVLTATPDSSDYRRALQTGADRAVCKRGSIDAVARAIARTCYELKRTSGRAGPSVGIIVPH